MNKPGPVGITAGESSDGGHQVCLTPTRNEAWIIRHFLEAAKLWASDIIVADQGSTDGTLQLLQETPGIQTVINDTSAYDEAHRQELLLNQARAIDGKRILIALDADEAFSANCVTSKEWQQINEAAPGTLLRFRWVNILPGFKEAWIPPQHTVFGFVDDGSNHSGRRIHSPRVPEPAGAPVLDLHEIVVLHFQYVLWDRMVSKHRWYQAWEHAKHREKGPLRIFREYHHMYGSWDKNEIQPLRPEWLEGYERAGIDFRSLKAEQVTWWDREVAQLLIEHGPEHFRKIAIWDTNWNTVAANAGLNGLSLSDPRSLPEKGAHWLLKASQKRRANLGVRAFEYLLRLSGW